MGACHGGGGRVRLAELAVLLAVGLYVVLLIHPISLVLPKETGCSPKKNAWGGSALVRFRDPPASPTRVGAATRPLRCPLRGLISSLAPGARGLGLWKSSQVKVFCPAFLQKSGRGPGAEPWPRAAARGTPLVRKKRRRGLKGEPSPGVPPLRAALPPAARATSWDRRSSDAGRGWNPAPTRGWRNVVGSAMDEEKGRRGRRPLRRVGDGPRSAGFTAILSYARAGVGGTR